jgi:hypothetical protein
MRNADELDEQWRELTGTLERGHIRYAFGAVPPRAEPWAAAEHVTAPQADLWVLVCGGIAAAAAFAAAFLASGGIGHAATPPAPAHNITVQACPAAVPGRPLTPSAPPRSAGG